MKHEIGKEALEYVKNRKLSEKTLKDFLIGLAPRDGRLIVNYLRKKGYKDEELIESGSFGKSQYGPRQIYDRFGGRLIFPQVDFRDRVVGFSGRVLPGANSNLAKYINSPETEIYHKSQMLFGLNLAKERIKKENWALIVEGELDMISPYQAGIENVVAIKGTALTEDQLQLIRRYTDTLILGLDSDFAGSKAAIRSIELAEKMDFEIKVLDLRGKYKDPDEAIKDDLNFFKSRLEEAESIWTFVLNSAVKNFGTETDRGKKEILKMVLPFLAKINNSVIKADYVKKLANEINSEEESVNEELKKYLGGKKEEVNEGLKKEVKEQDLREKLEERLLVLILKARNPRKLIKNIEWKTLKFKRIGERIKKYRKFEAEKIKNEIEAELRDIFNDLYLRACENNDSSEERKKERNKIVRRINEIELKNRQKELSGIIANLESSGKEEEMVKAELEYAQISAKLAILQRAKS